MTSDAILPDGDSSYAVQRRMMVECQVRPFDVTHHTILAAMLELPREAFVAPNVAPLAYSDRALSSAGGERRLLPPMVLARMLQAADVKRSDKLLDVGGGSGYGAAILARLTETVVALESDQSLSAAARTALARVGAARVVCVTGPLPAGHPAGAPFDVIVLNGAVEEVPEALLDQLADRGRLVAVDAARGAPKAVRYERTGTDVSVRPLFDAAAPLLDGFSKAPTFIF